jgi:hypothetical protein
MGGAKHAKEWLMLDVASENRLRRRLGLLLVPVAMVGGAALMTRIDTNAVPAARGLISLVSGSHDAAAPKLAPAARTLPCVASGPGDAAPTPNVSVHGEHGCALGADPLLQPGDKVSVTVSGFAPHAAVTTWLSGDSTRTSRVADGAGRVRVRLVVRDLTPGTHRLAAQAVDATAANAGGGNVVAQVPVFGIFPFRVASPSV